MIASKTKTRTRFSLVKLTTLAVVALVASSFVAAAPVPTTTNMMGAPQTTPCANPTTLQVPRDEEQDQVDEAQLAHGGRRAQVDTPYQAPPAYAPHPPRNRQAPGEHVQRQPQHPQPPRAQPQHPQPPRHQPQHPQPPRQEPQHPQPPRQQPQYPQHPGPIPPRPHPGRRQEQPPVHPPPPQHPGQGGQIPPAAPRPPAHKPQCNNVLCALHQAKMKMINDVVNKVGGAVNVISGPNPVSNVVGGIVGKAADVAGGLAGVVQTVTGDVPIVGDLVDAAVDVAAGGVNVVGGVVDVGRQLGL